MKLISKLSLYYLVAASIFITGLVKAAPASIEIAEPPDPLEFGNVVDLIVAIINYVLGIAGLIAVVFIINGGIQYVTSAGNEEKTKRATSSLTYAVIGLVVVFAAYAIKVSIENAIGIGTGSFFPW